MSISNNQRGSSYIIAILGLAIVVVVGVVGYRVMHNTDTGNISGVTPARSTNVPKEIKSKADLKKAEQALDSMAIDSGVNPNQLDGEL